MTPHSSTLAWKIPWTEEPGGLQSMGLLRVRHNFTFTFHFHALEKEMATHSSVLAWRIPGTGEPGGLPSMGLHRVGQDWSDLAATLLYHKVWYHFVRYACKVLSCIYLLNHGSLTTCSLYIYVSLINSFIAEKLKSRDHVSKMFF